LHLPSLACGSGMMKSLQLNYCVAPQYKNKIIKAL
jgi:hypothetical protein